MYQGNIYQLLSRTDKHADVIQISSSEDPQIEFDFDSNSKVLPIPDIAYIDGIQKSVINQQLKVGRRFIFSERFVTLVHDLLGRTELKIIKYENINFYIPNFECIEIPFSLENASLHVIEASQGHIPDNTHIFQIRRILREDGRSYSGSEVYLTEKFANRMKKGKEEYGMRSLPLPQIPYGMSKNMQQEL
jgi:hypothetical protein